MCFFLQTIYVTWWDLLNYILLTWPDLPYRLSHSHSDDWGVNVVVIVAKVGCLEWERLRGAHTLVQAGVIIWHIGVELILGEVVGRLAIEVNGRLVMIILLLT